MKSERILRISLIWFIALWVMAIIILGGVPPVSRDALTHHLAIPKLYLKHGGMYEIPELPVSYYPMNVDLLYLIPLIWGNDIVPKFIHFGFALLTAGLIFRYLKKRIDSTYALIGVLLFLTLPVVVKLSITVYVDLGLIFFSTAALYFLFKWIESDFNPKYLLFSALWCGLAMGTKYNGLITLFAMGGAVPVVYVRLAPNRKMKQFKAAGWGLCYIGVALLIFSPWLVRNYAWVQNPIHPLFENRLFAKDPTSTPAISHFVLRRDVFGEKWWETVLIPLRVFFQGQDNSPKYFDGKLNPYLFLLPLLALCSRNTNRFETAEKSVLLFFAGCYLLITFLGNEMRIRYIGPLIPALVILAVYGLRSLASIFDPKQLSGWDKVSRGAVLSGLLFLGSQNLIYIVDQFKHVDPLPYLSGRIHRDAYIERYRPEYAAIKYANLNLSGRVKLLGLFLGNRAYYSEHEIIFNHPRFKKIVQHADSSMRIAADLKQIGVTHLIVGHNLYNRWSHARFSPHEKGMLAKFYRKHLRQLFSQGGYGLYALVMLD